MSFIDSLDSLTPVAPPEERKIVPTAEQHLIIEAAKSTSDNLAIRALAGAAKTSTLVMVANDPAMQPIATLCLAFNKKIAEEMKNRLPSNCTSMTLNSLGHKVWGQQLGKRLNLQTKKNGDILAALIKEERKDIQDKLWDQYADLLRTFAHGKSQGWVPDSCRRRGPKALLTNQEFFESLDEELGGTEEKLLINAMNIGIDQAYEGLIDFDDQIFMPTCFPAKFPSYPLTMIDESQDLSSLNHSMLEQVVGTNRLFAVGDPCQAIYGFRGAYANSMDLLQEKFSMTVLTLSTSFRCPRAVVREAQWRAPHMNAPDWAEEGEVKSLITEWGVENLTADAVIICRNNAPIFSMAIRLLREGRYPQIVGNDIGKTLIKALGKLGEKNLPQEAAFQELAEYKRRRLSKAREQARGAVEDFCSCMAVFLEKGDTLGAAISYADYLMNQTGPIKMMTGHKSKGLEFDNIFILDRQLLRINEDTGGGKNQDKNLLYVMQTRAKKTLTYITSEAFIGSEPKTEE